MLLSRNNLKVRKMNAGVTCDLVPHHRWVELSKTRKFGLNWFAVIVDTNNYYAAA